jgi:hypothetical protein
VKIAVSPQYIPAAMSSASSRSVTFSLAASCARRNSSARPTSLPRKLTSAVSFIMAMNSFPVGGMITRVACGSTIRRMRCA